MSFFPFQELRVLLLRDHPAMERGIPREGREQPEEETGEHAKGLSHQQPSSPSLRGLTV